MGSITKSRPETCPLVSFIVVNYNGAAYLAETIGSLQGQDYPRKEIIVVDNCSSDDSVALLEQQFPDVKLVRSERNLGFAGGNNLGFAQASGELWALVNNDVVLDPGWTSAMVAATLAWPRAGLFASKVYLAGTSRVLNSTGTLIYPDLTCVNRGMREQDLGQYDQSLEVFGIYGAAALLRRKMLEQAGWFDASYFMHREEDDLVLRCRLAGWGCIFVPSAMAYHRWSQASGGGGSLFKLYYGERNRIRNVIKYLPPDLMLSSCYHTFRRLWILRRVPKAATGSCQNKAGKSRVTLWRTLTTLLRAWLDGWATPSAYRFRRRMRPVASSYRKKLLELLNAYPATLKHIQNFYQDHASTPR